MNQNHPTLWYQRIDVGWARFHALATPSGLAALWPVLAKGDAPDTVPDDLRADLVRSFPGASIATDAAPVEVSHLMQQLAQALGRSGELREIPIHYGVMPQFRRDVLEHLRGIPAQQQRSYRDVAHALGRPSGAARAVGQACAANRWAVVVPCHRVRSSSGQSLGFRWGAPCRQLFDQHA